MLRCFVNGQETGSIAADHRLVAFGDGLFETCYTDENGVQFRADHLDRLARGARRLGLRWEADDVRALDREIDQALASVEQPVILKVIIGRGVNGRGYDYDPSSQWTDRVIQLSPYRAPPWSAHGAQVVLSTAHASANPDLAGLKHCNRFDSVLARQSARAAGAHEAWMTLPDGRLLEGSMSNLYLRLGHNWYTPRLDLGGVDGIIRQRLLQAPGFSLIEADLYPSHLPRIDAALISNSLLGLVPVTKLDGTPLSAPGTEMLTELRRNIGLNA